MSEANAVIPAKAGIQENDLPEGWADAQLSDLSERITKGSTPTSYGYEYKTEGIKFIKAENIDAAGHATTTSNYIDDETHEFLARSQLKENDLLFSIAGTIGRVGIVRDIDLPANTNQALAIIRLADKALDIKYLYYYLNSPQIQTVVLTKIVGVGRANLSLTNIGDFRVPLAPPEQQKRIVAKIEELFSHIDAGIEALKKAKQLLKQYRQSVLKAAVTGELTKEWREANKDKLVPATQLLERILKERRQKWEEQQLEQFKAKGKMPKNDKWKEKYKAPVDPVVESLPDLPEEWLWVRLDCIAEIGSGMSVSKSRKVADPIEVPYLRVANVQRGFLNLEEIKTMPIEKTKLVNLELKEWDVLYNEGGDIDKLGRGWIWENQVEPCITQNHVFRASPYIKNRYHSVFLSTWGNTFGQEHFLNTGIQTTNLASINKGVLSAFPTPVPSLEEQEQIIQVVEDKLSSINRLECEVDTQLIKAEKNKQSILATAFTGVLPC